MAFGFAYMKLAPTIRTWFDRPARKAPAASGPEDHDPLGDAVDNIFKFDDEKRKKRK